MKNGAFKDSQRIIADQQANEKNYWLNRMSGRLVKSFFPYNPDSREKPVNGSSTALFPFVWSGTLANGLTRQSNGSPYKLHILLLAGITLLLDKYTGNSDIIVSTPIYKPETQGKFVNVILPVRTQPDPGQTVKELLKQVSSSLVEASAHQNYPMEILLEQLNMPVQAGEPSLLETAVVIENIHDPAHMRVTNTGMIFSFRMTEHAINGQVEYPARLYEKTAITRIILHLEQLLGQALENLDQPLSRLELVPEPEKTQFLHEFSEINYQEMSNRGILPAGADLPGQRVYILDRYKNIQPLGLEGEVYIAGPAIAGRIEDPFFPGQYMVQTGDLARRLPEGAFAYSGRSENRFMFRGNWIQPEQLEQYLQNFFRFDGLVVAITREDSHQETLCAYFVSQEDYSLSSAQWQEQLTLTGTLPAYLIPGSFVRLDSIPLTPEGKINRNGHELQELCARVRVQYAAPADGIEEKLAAIWAEVFEIEPETLRMDADFSQLGGQSLRAIMMSSRIHKEFDISIPIPTIFHLATIRGMAQYIKETKKTEFCPVEPAEKREYYELSPGQKRLYLLQQIEMESTGYNVPQIVRLEGQMQRERLQETFTRLIGTHESLRTSFSMVEDKPVQRVHDTAEFAIRFHDLRDLSTEEKEKKSREIAGSFIRPFDLSRAPLLRVELVKEDEHRHILMVDRHHIISDATSRAIFLRDLILLYDGKELPCLKLQYKDYSQWLSSKAQKQAIKEQENHWLKQFQEEGEIPVLNLPLDYPRPMVQSFAGNVLGFSLGEQETRQLRDLAAREGATLFMTLLAVYTILLAKICGQEDIIVGTPVLGRRHRDLENIMGIFVNTLALRNFPGGWRTFTGFLNHVKIRALTAFENQDYPFEDLVDRVSINRDISRNPLFDTVFILDDVGGPDPGEEKQELKVLPYGFQYTDSKFDLTLNCSAGDETLHFFLEYGTKLFDITTIKRFADFLKKIIRDILADNQVKLAEIEIISTEEKRQLLEEFNHTETPYPGEKTIHGLFTEQAQQTPDHIALIGIEDTGTEWQDEIDKTDAPEQVMHVTYNRLDESSHCLALRLREMGAGSDTVMGIMARRSVEMMLGIFGILKAGGAYLPIDPNYPGERIQYLLKDSGAHLLVTTSLLAEEVKNSKRREIKNNFNVLFIDTFEFSSSSSSSSSCSASSHSTDLAYVIYTSGSTGMPKGVMIDHYSVINRLNWMQRFYPLNKDDIILQKTPYTFDVSVWELFWWSFWGASLCLLGAGQEKDPAEIARVLQKQKITTLHFVPSMLNTFLEYLEHTEDRDQPQFPALARIFSSGEALLPYHLEKFHNQVTRKTGAKTRLINLYGPTEATVDVSYFECPLDKELACIPIGKPIDNITLYVLDRYSRLQPMGIAGELCISGKGVGRGYLNRQELTNQTFLRGVQGGGFYKKSPPGRRRQRIYKTGDLARWWQDGNIEYLGRMDFQVKIRGFRIELGEIENRLLKYNGIKEAVVTANQGQAGDLYLCAFFVSGSGQAPELEKLREYLSAALPDYMVPTFFVPVERIPLTVSGKVDKKALPRPGIKATDNYLAPRNSLEEALRQIWSDLLGIEKTLISMDTDFFASGGHSLNANIMVSKIHKVLEVRIPLTEVFKNKTVRGLAQYIEKSRKEKFSSIEPVEKREYHELSSAQKRLYFLRELDAGSITYNIPLVMPLGRDVDRQALEEALKRLIARHESLRTSFQRVNGAVVQRIHQAGQSEFATEFFPVAGMAGAIEKATQFIRPFDLETAPLLRSGIIRFPDGSHTWIVDIHHIVSDGTSHAVLRRDFMALYNGEELAPLRLQYRDFSCWQNRFFASGAIKTQEEYWLELYRDIEDIPHLDLPADFKRPEVFNFAGDHYTFVLEAQAARKFKQLGNRNGGTLYMNILAVLNTLFYKYTGQDNIIIGSMIAGRPHADLQQIIGMFVNTLAMRNYPGGEKTFQSFLREVIDNSIQAFANQEVQFEDLVEKLKPPRDLSRNPLFDITLVLQNIGEPVGGQVQPGKDSRNQGVLTGDAKKSKEAEEAEKAGEDPGSEGIDSTNKTSKFDMTFFVRERGDEIDFTIQYYTAIFKLETIQRLVRHFKNLVNVVTEDPLTRLGDIEIMPQEERERILYRFNDTDRDYMTNRTIYQWFEEQVERYPDHLALTGAETGMPVPGTGSHKHTRQVTYRAFQEKSGELAQRLIERGVRVDTLVGIMVERSLEMVIGIYAILRAGGAYLPIDPGYPAERIYYIFNDSQAKYCVTTADLSGKIEPLAPVDFQLLIVDEEPPAGLEVGSLRNALPAVPTPPVSSLLTSLAYIIYTSGSTGNPKGVLIDHASVMNVIQALQEKYPLWAADVYLLKTSFLFDVSVTELFGWFVAGGRLAVLEKGGEKNPQAILDTIEHTGVTHINFVPSMFQVLLETLDTADSANIKKLSPLTYIFLAGEAFLPGLVETFNRLKTGIILENIYGPTENTVYASHYSLSEWTAGSIPIGKPLPNIRLYVLDTNNRIQPTGIVGELCLGGSGLARGYLNRPQLTSEKFINFVPPGPKSANKKLLRGVQGGSFLEKSPPGSRRQNIYKTGDLARWLADGNIDFLGRKDFQVKIRGFRVELGEIEARLSRYPGIKETVVLSRKPADVDVSSLFAYFVPDGDRGTGLSVTQLRQYLSRQLPDYMIPSHFIKVERIPLTLTGKIDRKALEVLGTRVMPQTAYIPPRSETEAKVAEIWKEALRMERVGIHDNYFDLGGTSFDIIRINGKLREVFQVDIPLVTMFRYTTVYLLAKYIDGDEGMAGEEEIRGREEKFKKGKASRQQRRQKRKGARRQDNEGDEGEEEEDDDEEEEEEKDAEVKP